MPITVTTVPKDASETLVFVADFSHFDEAKGGETLSSPSVPAVSGITLGSPTVTSAVTYQIPSGYGIKFTIAGGTVSTTYTVEVFGTFSGGAIRCRKYKVEVE